MKPLFIFSLPRSGSTLLQKIIASTGKVATSAEPWLLLPHLYAMKSKGIASEYGHGSAATAISCFCQGLPRGEEDYISELRMFIMNLYKKRAEQEALYFLDKTPRYHLICKEIIDIFPEAKFIFLWRNPLAIVSSMLNSWCNGRWKIDLYNIDLYDGINNLIEAYEHNCKDFLSLKYEDLVINPETEIDKICSFLQIDFNKVILQSFKEIDFGKGMGDKVGVLKFQEINSSSTGTWSNAFCTPLRRRWALKYLRELGEQRLGAIGYNYRSIKEELLAQRGISPCLLFIDLLITSRERFKNLLSCNYQKRFHNLRYS